MMLNSDVRKGGGGLIKCGHLQMGGGGMKRGHFCGRPLWTIPVVAYTCVVPQKNLTKVQNIATQPT